MKIILAMPFTNSDDGIFPHTSRHYNDPKGVAELSPGLPESARATPGPDPISPIAFARSAASAASISGVLRAIIALLTIYLLSGVSAFSQSQPPAVIDQLGPDTSLKYLTKVSEIPKSVVGVITNAMRIDQLKMADKGGKWNATDVVSDPDLPFRRLIWAVETQQKHFVVHYEFGGIGYSTHFLVISPPDTHGKRNLEWAAVCFEKKKDLKEFLTAAKNRKLDTDNRLAP